MVFSIRKMKTKVLVIHCVAGMPVDRTLHTPLKKVTVYLPEEVNQTTPKLPRKSGAVGASGFEIGNRERSAI
jgi:hypothetical protein